MTAGLNATITAAQWNTHVRDNLLETEAAKAANDGGYFVATAANAIVQRQAGSQFVLTRESTTSTSYTDLSTSGPAVTVTSGTTALVWISAELDTNTVDALTKFSYAVSGASTVAASDDWGVWTDGQYDGSATRKGVCHRHTGLTAGSNTFTMKYAAGSNTASFAKREIIVMPF